MFTRPEQIKLYECKKPEKGMISFTYLHQLVVVSAQFCFEMNNNLNQLPFILYLTTKAFFVLFFLFFWKRDLCSRW